MHIKTAYYSEGGFNTKGECETPHIIDDEYEAHGGKAYFLIRCAVCHYGLCKLMTIAPIPHEDKNIVFVQPCPICTEAARRHADPPVIPINTIGSRLAGLEITA
jgi:hypothetical protein